MEVDVGEVNDEGVMVVHRPDGDEFYEITEIPSDATYLVQREKKDILKGLGLQKVLTELNRTSDLLYLAYVGVVGTGELHARLLNRQMDLSKLCQEYLLTMIAMENGSRLVLQRVTEAYKYLLQANEPRALNILSKCAENADTMSAACAKLAAGFGKMLDDTEEDRATAAVALGQQVTKFRELKTLRDKRQANKLNQESQSKLLNETIRKMEAEIQEEKAKEELADKRAFIANIVGSVTGALAAGLGAGLSAYKASDQPVKINFQQPGSSPAPSGGKDVSEEEVRQLKNEDEKSKKVLEDGKSAEEHAREKARDVHSRVLDATAVKDAKQKRLDAKQKQLDAAKAGDNAEAGYEEKVKEAQAALDASSEKLAGLEAEKKEADRKLNAAEKTVRDAAVAVSVAATGLKSIAEPAGQVWQEPADRVNEIASNLKLLVQQRLKMEELHRESVGIHAELTSLLDANTQETLVEESAPVALEIAGWALQNVFVALIKAKGFWDSMTTSCEELAKADTVVDEVEFGSTAEERKKVYRSEDFVRPAMGDVAKWAALIAVCGEYVKASELVRQSVLGHIKSAPTIEEAREEARRLIGPLKARLQKEIGDDADASAVRIDDLEAAAAQIEGTEAQVT